MWHLLSLDAATVAAVWTVFIAWSAGVRLPWSDPVAMFVAVWMLYAVDRLLDARPLFADAISPDLEERHRFHHRHRKEFLWGLLGATLCLAVLLQSLPFSVLHLYVLLGSALFGWLALVHLQPPSFGSNHRLPKELAVGLFFPAAVFIPTVAREPALRLVLLPEALLFAAVCSLNCLFLFAWEHPHTSVPAHVSTRWSVQRVVWLALLAVVAPLILSTGSFLADHGFAAAGRPLPAHLAVMPLASALSALLLLLLHARRSTIPRLHLRALADLVLLTPLLCILLSRVLGSRP